jgi:hypothetical protein
VLLAVVIRDTLVIGISGDDDALAADIAFEVFVGVETFLPTETFIIPFSGDGDADVLGVTDEVLAGVAFVTLSAFIRSLPINNSTEISDALKVFIILKTVGICSAFIIPSAINRDAGVTLADVVFLAVVAGDTFVVGITGDDDTRGGGGACEMFTRIDAIGTGLTSTLHISWQTDAEIIPACQVIPRSHTITIEYTCIRGFPINNHASLVDALQMLAGFQTITVIRAFASAEPGKFNARIPIANCMRTPWNTLPAGKLVAGRSITVGILHRIFACRGLAHPVDAAGQGPTIGTHIR